MAAIRLRHRRHRRHRPSEAVSVSHLSPESFLSGLSSPSAPQVEAAYLRREGKHNAGRRREGLNCVFSRSIDITRVPPGVDF